MSDDVRRGTGTSLAGIDWVIVGGESGPGARPMHPDWARFLRDQCAAAGVAYFHKQWGEWAPRRMLGLDVQAGQDWGTISADGRFWPTTTPWNGHDDDGHGDGEAVVVRVGKRAAGRLLDGVEHNEFPGGGS